MNKKFSTLVASLLLSSAFSVYAGNAKPMLATPTQVETRAASADVEEAKEANVVITDFETLVPALKTHVLPGFTNNALLYVVNQNVQNALVKFTKTAGTNDIEGVAYPGGYTAATPNAFYWTLKDGQLVSNDGEVMAVEGASTYFEVIPLLQKTSLEPTPYFALATRADGTLKYVQFDGTKFSLVSAGANESVSATAATFASIEPQYNVKQSPADLNNVLGNGFNLSISSLIKEDAEILDAEVFDGVLTAYDQNTGKPSLDATKTAYIQLKNAAGKFVVFEKDTRITSDGVAELGMFKLVDAVDPSKQYSYFHASKSDNGSEDVLVRVADDAAGTNNFRLYIANTRGTYALSIAKEDRTGLASLDAKNWAVTSLAKNTYVDLKQFLAGKFVNVEFVAAAEDNNNNAYKKDGILAVKPNGSNYKADFVAKSGVYSKAPEAQWAVLTDDNGATIKLANRENIGAAVEITSLRFTNTANVYEVVGSSDNAVLTVGDLIKITFVEEHSKHDGYAVFSDNDLRNETYYLGQIRQAQGEDINVYWAENHIASHQIGATVEESGASKWNISLVNKTIADHTSEVDSVLVESTLQTWNVSKNRVESKKDTLVILPYAFQNRSNNEFVKLNDQVNLEYYICDETNKDDATKAQRFALKMKADGTYNYIALEANAYHGKDNAAVKPNAGFTIVKKVYQENSTDRGTWREMGAYDGDANALMFVTKVQAPEYRKLVTTANLDTIKLYRADNEAQVVYEKKDTKASTLLERPVSFLNIDNVEQFKDINPALYADTAYVNRGNNTRYQYLLGVNIEHKEGWYCDEHGFTETPPCKHAVPVSYNQGRYLINMIDTANILAADLKVSIHNNPFINETEEGNKCAKLAFVDAIHVLTDSVDMTKADKLYVINNEEDRTKYSVIDLSTPGFNVAKFAFKYTDSMVDDNFKIQTQWKDYNPNGYNKPGYKMHDEGYLRWVNGCLVVDETYQKGDVFNMNEDETRTPTANEEITAEGSVVVAGTNGAVVVKGAEGKSVIVSTILGKVVANEVLTSDNATIAAPAGVVVVSVDGESFKVVVK